MINIELTRFRVIKGKSEKVQMLFIWHQIRIEKGKLLHGIYPIILNSLKKQKE